MNLVAACVANDEAVSDADADRDAVASIVAGPPDAGPR